MTYGTSDGSTIDRSTPKSDPKFPDPVNPDASNTGSSFDTSTDPSPLWDAAVADVPGGTDHPGRGLTVVNVAAIKTFAANIETLLPLIDTAIKELEGVKIGAGYLGAGTNLRETVVGANGLRDNSRKLLVDAKNALMRVVAACEEIASRYSTAEDLNAMDAEAFAREVSAARGAINSITPT